MLQEVEEHRHRYIFIDEVTFSCKDRHDRSWSKAGSQQVIRKKDRYFPVVACVGAIDGEGNLLQLSTFEKSVDTFKFI